MSPESTQTIQKFGAFYCKKTDHICSVLGTKRVHNNIIYNEYINDREHVHMNSTQWETLTDFTKWLGREGKLS